MHSYEMLSRWYETYQSAYYLFDADHLLANYRRMHRAFQNRYPHVQIAYSYKTNYLPFLCHTLHQAGAWAEVVSGLEYELAKKLAVPYEQIIFNGPLKREAELIEALQRQSLLNLDSFHELHTVIRFARSRPDRQIKVGLRVNFSLTDAGDSPLQDGLPVSRFGFCVENGDYRKALAILQQEPNIQVTGLHGHFSTNRSLAVYDTLTRKLSRLAEDLGDELVYVDIGGGMSGPLPATFAQRAPTYEEYAEVIGRALHEELGARGKMPLLILEPGISLVADTFSFICKVIDVKENRGQRFVLVDGSVHNIKPTLHKHPMPVQLVAAEQREDAAEYHVVGYTCMEKDYLLTAHKGPLPQAGDFLVFSHVGAYTIVFSPPFIKERPPIIALYRQTAREVRAKETSDEFFSERLYSFSFA
ncbi:diaminopimelate decarboxylase [Brevibacillus fulvus]|uniref:Diaminopimelate decarboxylase n=1 Tax=Brevibacillus fulvus TaxID=1125967 RepID=A0A938XS41_9BACL|nr:diaminopimelate decarboxylase [Brevibacillus fulvus]MBM7588907.1 diaminopimelate decarboxylase [Brevibacillus fulvus]